MLLRIFPKKLSKVWSGFFFLFRVKYKEKIVKLFKKKVLLNKKEIKLDVWEIINPSKL